MTASRCPPRLAAGRCVDSADAVRHAEAVGEPVQRKTYAEYLEVYRREGDV